MRKIYVSEGKAVQKYLVARDILLRYEKAKMYLSEGNAKAVDFKKRQPKNDGFWYF